MKAPFILVPGAGGAAEYWQRVVPLLEAQGHEAIAVSLPAADESASLDDYAARVIEAMGDRRDVIVVAQSLGGFTAPLVASRASRAVGGIVFVNAMIPRPNEAADAWGGNTGSRAARVARAKEQGYPTDFDVATYFLHDIPDDVARDLLREERPQAAKAMNDPCRFDAWPNVPMRVIVGADDRLFPRDFQHRVAKERLGDAVAIDDIRGGHLVALSNPTELTDRWLAFARDRRS